MGHWVAEEPAAEGSSRRGSGTAPKGLKTPCQEGQALSGLQAGCVEVRISVRRAAHGSQTLWSRRAGFPKRSASGGGNGMRARHLSRRALGSPGTEDRKVRKVCCEKRGISGGRRRERRPEVHGKGPSTAALRGPAGLRHLGKTGWGSSLRSATRLRLKKTLRPPALSFLFANKGTPTTIKLQNSFH